MKSKLTIGALVLGLVSANAAQAMDVNMDALKAEAKTVVMSFGGPLKKALGGAMKEGGPVNAIGVCNEQAPGIAMTAAKNSGWNVGRTSLKLRNPGNEPDAWEMGVLKMFEDRKAKGEAVNMLAHGEVVETNGKKQFRFMKAIGTADLCLNCHGKTLKPEIITKLDGLYPADQARGFSAGDIRGAFTLSKDL